MPLFSFFKGPDINEGAARCRETPEALLVDVREADEYAAGHIPGSINVPLSRLSRIDDVAPDYDTPLFVYCLGGGRSAQAAAQLAEMGYTRVENIGGINRWRGETVR